LRRSLEPSPKEILADVHLVRKPVNPAQRALFDAVLAAKKDTDSDYQPKLREAFRRFAALDGVLVSELDPQGAVLTFRVNDYKADSGRKFF